MKTRLQIQKKAPSTQLRKKTPSISLLQTRPFDVNDNLTQSHFENNAQGNQSLTSNLSKISVSAPIQAKMTIGAIGDQYEQEADHTANQVVEQINQPASVQREAAPEEEELQMKPDSIQREAAPEEEELQMKPDSIQREAAPEEEELQMKPNSIQREADGSMTASPNIEGAIQEHKGKGQPLDKGVRGKMEKAFNADFSGVRVHHSAQSDQINKSIQAKAFTTGQDLFFRQGAYDPNSRNGQELLAHELTHVVQQNGPSVQQKKDR